MSTLNQRIESLIELGKWLFKFDYDNQLNETIERQHIYNQWHTKENIHLEIKSWCIRLSEHSICSFIEKYKIVENENTVKIIAVIPSNNLVFSGLHELICCVLANQQFVCVNTEHQQNILQYITKKLIEINPKLSTIISWETAIPKHINNFIVHSDNLKNTVLKQYFAKRKSIIIEKRVSVAIVTETITTEDFEMLGDDIFRNYGHSPYNVRKMFVPRSFSISMFYEAIEKYFPIYSHNKYANNYDYHKSILLMDQKPFFDNGFIILRESPELFVPIGCLYYEYYDSAEQLAQIQKNNESKIQQVVSNSAIHSSKKFGQALNFHLHDFEDHKNIMQFILDEK